MKISFEPTTKDTNQHGVVIVSASDDLDFNGTMELVKMALLGWGFQPANIIDYFPEEGI